MTADNWFILAIISGLIAIIGLIGLVVFISLQRRRRRARLTSTDASKAKQLLFAGKIKYGKCSYSPSFVQDFRFSAQDMAWQKSMNEIGRVLRQNKVAAVGLLHGTYVGTDPVGFLTFLRQQNIPRVNRLIDRMQPLIKSGIDRVTRDLGNFCEPYRRLLQESLGEQITVDAVHWPSGNYHVARLKGALNTLDWIDEKIAVSAGERSRILLIGHSHAGQVFALLSRLLFEKTERENILRVAASVMPNLSIEEWQAKLDRVQRQQLDFVTLGTPPIYTWSRTTKLRILNIVNHRGEPFDGGSVFGILHTKSGDYIQQLAVNGTDSLAFSRAERSANLVLDEILGKGIAISSYMHFVHEQRRLYEDGVTYLIDFCDASSRFPNAIQTFFGHGVYTKGSAMLDIWKTITREFYSE